MENKLRVLVLEDLPSDAELAQRELKKVLHNFTVKIVDTKEGFLQGLDDFKPDLIISDYQLPAFDGLSALQLTQKKSPFIPFIILTGSMNEDTAAECMKAGADDYVIKEHIKRLGPAAMNVLEKKKLEQERHQAMAVLRESEERYRTLTEAAQDAIFIIDREDNIVFVNSFGAGLLGQAPIDVIGKSRSKMFSPEVAEHQNQALQKVFKSGKPLHTESKTVFGKRDVWLSTHLVPLKNDTGEIDAVLGVSRDITERKRTEDELKTLSTAIEQSPAVVMITDPQGNIEYVNPKFCEITGYSTEEVAGKNPRIMKSGETRPEEYETLWKTITAGGEWHGEFHNRKKNGEFYWESASISAIKNSAGVIMHFLAIKEDVTAYKRAEEKRKQLEEQLQQAQKMETLGTLAGGIAHDFNNILQAIRGYVEMSLEELPPKSQTHADLQEVMKAANRGKELVQQILAFSRRAVREPIPLRIHSIVREALNLLQATLPTTIDLRHDLKRKCGTILADPAQIHQVVMNLCTNASQAMRKKGGVLTVSVERVVADAEFLQSHPKRNEQEYVQLTVSDTGEGMDQATTERIFEPFFTTKEVGEGTGLGLSVVHGIVKSHKGYIAVESEPAKGATFRVNFPVIEGTAEVVKKRDEKIANGHERILLVDDQEVVVSVMKRLLQRSGYEVTARKSGAETLETFKACPDSFDLVITDQIMPKMTGVKLAGELLNIRPDLPIILMSGFDEGVTEETAKARGIKGFIQKPVGAGDLNKAVRRAMDGKKQSVKVLNS